MAIVAIARERGAMGEIVAKELAKQMNYRFVDKRIVEERLEALGLSEKNRQSFDEKKPGFFAAFTSAMDDYIRCLKNILFEEAIQGNCVFLGRGCQFLFKDIPGTVLIRLVAPLETRIQRVKEHMGLDDRSARLEVTHKDRDREQFNEHFFDVGWKNPENYHLTINTEGIAASDIVGIIKETIAIRIKPEAIPVGQAMLRNLALAQAITRHILHDLKLPVFFLEVECAGNEATLNGIAHSVDTIGRACEAAKIQGIERVNCKISVGRLAN